MVKETLEPGVPAVSSALSDDHIALAPESLASEVADVYLSFVAMNLVTMDVDVHAHIIMQSSTQEPVSVTDAGTIIRYSTPRS